jgi:hypothetical protein
LWLHLLSLDLNFTSYPSDTRVTDCSVAWANWWQKFVKPFARISNSLCDGNITGRIAYDERKKNKCALQNHITTRPLSTNDLKVVKRVPGRKQAQYISVIEKIEGRIKSCWMPRLQGYLQDVMAVRLCIQKRSAIDVYLLLSLYI